MTLVYNLQYFANKDGPGGEKTEAATPKKLEDSRKKGQVAKSKEMSSAMGLMTLFLVLKFGISYIGNNLLGSFSVVYERIPELVRALALSDSSGNDIFIYFRQVLIQILKIQAPLFLIACLVAFITDLVQVKWKPTTDPLKPKFSKLNPVKGMKKIFSKKNLVELLKSIFKLGLIGWVAYSTLRKQWSNLFLLYDMPLWQAVGLMGDIIINMGIKLAAAYMIIAFGDYAYQRWDFSEEMKMSKQEVKDEMKNAEGDPQIKGKQRQRMREASMRRMMQEVPKADVVITNPTHFAVAIKYDPLVADAPIVVAKGEDHLAQKIKEAAKENNVEIVENKPLARMLYHNVDLGAMVPPELYQAVAEILAAVYHAQGKV